MFAVMGDIEDRLTRLESFHATEEEPVRLAIPEGAVRLNMGGEISGDFYVEGTLPLDRPIVPANGTRIFVPGDATIDGMCTTRTAIASNATGVSIIGTGKVRNFKPINQHGVIESRVYTAQQEPAEDRDLGTNWFIDGLQVSDSTGYAVVCGNETTLMDMKMLRMEHGGFTAHGGRGSRVIGSEVAYINQDRVIEPRWEAGNKIKHTDDFVVTGDCHFHHINGTAFWPDIQNSRSVIEDAIIHDICGPGIQYELSTSENSGTIRRVYLKRCGRDMDPWMFQAAVQLHSVQGVSVTEVEAVDCFNGVSVIHQQFRGMPTRDISVAGSSFINCGQSGINWEGGDMPERIEFLGNTWGLGLSQFRNNDDDFRRQNPYRYGGNFGSITAAEWDQLGITEGDVYV